MSAKVTVHIDYLVHTHGYIPCATLQAARGLVHRLLKADKVIARKRRPNGISARRWQGIHYRAWCLVDTGLTGTPTIIKRETRETVVS